MDRGGRRGQARPLEGRGREPARARGLPCISPASRLHLTRISAVSRQVESLRALEASLAEQLRETIRAEHLGFADQIKALHEQRTALQRPPPPPPGSPTKAEVAREHADGALEVSAIEQGVVSLRAQLQRVVPADGPGAAPASAPASPSKHGGIEAVARAVFSERLDEQVCACACTARTCMMCMVCTSAHVHVHGAHPLTRTARVCASREQRADGAAALTEQLGAREEAAAAGVALRASQLAAREESWGRKLEKVGAAAEPTHSAQPPAAVPCSVHRASLTTAGRRTAHTTPRCLPPCTARHRH